MAPLFQVDSTVKLLVVFIVGSNVIRLSNLFEVFGTSDASIYNLSGVHWINIFKHINISKIDITDQRS